ncbi:hypothetical protein QYF36_024468 [Acer negundo]|nr:hypothetical protein QYF36_024468 [Acer negundo]
MFSPGIMAMGMKKLNYQQEIKEENINLQEFGALCFKRQIKQGRKEYKEKEIGLLKSRFMLLRLKQLRRSGISFQVGKAKQSS